jgi:hypothetical protein
VVERSSTNFVPGSRGVNIKTSGNRTPWQPWSPGPSSPVSVKYPCYHNPTGCTSSWTQVLRPTQSIILHIPIPPFPGTWLGTGEIGTRPRESPRLEVIRWSGMRTVRYMYGSWSVHTLQTFRKGRAIDVALLFPLTFSRKVSRLGGLLCRWWYLTCIQGPGPDPGVRV